MRSHMETKISPAVQFVEIARQPRRVITWRWCPVCMTRTDHASEEHGGWERVRCQECGRQEEYRTG